MVIAAAASTATTTASSSAASLLQPLARSKPPETLGFSFRGPLLRPNSSFTSPKKSRRLVCSWSSLRAFYSAGSEAPVRAQREGIWSIRDDLEMPPMPSYSEGLEPEVQESFTTHFFRDRIVRCCGEITSKMANRLVTQLLYLDAVDPSKDIVMYVNCRGGSVVQGMAIFDTMQHIRPDVATVCVGLAASMGAFLLSAGKKGKRYSFPSSRISIQQPRGEVQGWVTDIDVQADEMKHHKATLIGYLALHTGQSLEKIYEDTDWDYYMSAKEAKEYGLIDAVIMNTFKALPPRQVSNE